MDISNWIRCDFWTAKEASLLLGGVNPEGAKCSEALDQKPADFWIGAVTCLNGSVLLPMEIPLPLVVSPESLRAVDQIQTANAPILERRAELAARVVRIFELIRRSALYPQASPQATIEWAISKGLEIPLALAGEYQSQISRGQESPTQRRQRLTERLQKEKSKGTKAYLRVVAEEEGISISRLKQLTTPKPDASGQWTGLANPGGSRGRKGDKSKT